MNRENENLFSLFSYIILGLILVWVSIIINPFSDSFSIVRWLYYFVIAISIILSVVTITIYLNYNDIIESSLETIIYLIIIVGVLLRLFYIFYTPYDTRQHDLGTTNDSGHLGYIYYILRNSKLPDNYNGQFYHPPLHHFIASIFIKFNYLLGFSAERTNEAIQYLTVFYSSVCLMVSYNIFEELFENIKLRMLLIFLIAVHPTFIILGGSINNDILSIMFFLQTLFFLIKWYKHPTIKNIFLMALMLGLGMMAKLSVVMIAPVIVAVFIVKLIKNFKNKNIYIQYSVFALVSIPLGMWHSIRNLILFNQKIGYVLQIDINSDIYTGNHSIFRRFFYIPLKEFFASQYAWPFDDYNIPAYIIKCFTFGEYYYSENVNLQSWTLLFFSMAVIFISVFCLVYTLINYEKIKTKVYYNIMLGVWFFQMLSFVFFNLRYPFGCTMDTRYIVPTIICGCYFIYSYFEIAPEDKFKKLNNYFTFIIIGFGIASIWMYTLII